MADEPNVSVLKEISAKLDKQEAVAEKQADYGLQAWKQAKDYAASLEKKGKWDKKSQEQQNEKAAEMYELYKDSGALTIAEFKEMRKLEEDAAKDRKLRAGAETREAFELRKSLIDKGIKDEDFLAKAESDRRDGLAITADQYEGEFESFKLAAKKDKRDQADKRKKDKKEEERLATNMRSEESLKGILGSLGMSQKMAEKAAKKAMQMKESVHKWWEDKKEKIAAGAKSILSWLLKAAGIGLLWLLFKYLAGLDWKKLWEDAQGWGEVMKSFWSGIVSMGAWVGALSFGPWVKGLFGPNGSLFNFGQKMKGLWDSFKKLKFVKWIADTSKAFKTNIVTAITNVFTKLKANKFIGPLFEGISKIFKAGGKYLNCLVVERN